MNLFATLNPSLSCAAAAVVMGMGADAGGATRYGRAALQRAVAQPGELKDGGRVCR